MKGSHAVGLLELVCAVVLVSGIGGLAGLAKAPQPEEALGTAFTYQGRLTDNGSPAEGAYDFQFKLYDAFAGGNLLGTVTPGDVPVSGGLFTVKLDFGSGVFSGDARWLEIGVRPGDSGGAYTLLDPRQELTPSPYALALPGLWTQQNGVSPNLIGGYNGNWTTTGVTGATIGGGGDVNWPNRVTDDFCTVGGGQNNQAGDGDDDPGGARLATVGGGWENTASGDFTTVAGGAGNIAGGNLATVAGGHVNIASGDAATVGGGESNQATSTYATVDGGFANTAAGESSTVGGGMDNHADGWRATVAGGNNGTASGDFATIAGGSENTASGDYATVGGGNYNTAQGTYSLAVGHRAEAYNSGCFVWGDSSAADVTCENDNRWVARTSGGVYFYTSSDLSSGVYVPAGGNAWSSVSDRDLKENVAAVDGQEVLARLAEVPITRWNYKSQDAAIRHMGPMAQDFYGAFGLGEDATHISTVDADGVALAAIQGLYAENQALKAENADQEAQIATLQEENAGLDARLTALEKTVGSGQPAQARSSAAVPWLVAGGLVVAGGTVAGWRRRPGGGR